VVDYWIDSSVLINAKNQYYGFTRVPAFWRFIEVKLLISALGCKRDQAA
jgi:Domain of unknown function (DUF4411)